MRILIRIVHDADDRDALAADLARDVAIEILGGDHGDLIFGGQRGNGLAEHRTQKRGRQRRLS